MHQGTLLILMEILNLRLHDTVFITFSLLHPLAVGSFIVKIDALLISRKRKGWIIFQEGLNEMFDHDGWGQKMTSLIRDPYVQQSLTHYLISLIVWTISVETVSFDAEISCNLSSILSESSIRFHSGKDTSGL